MMQLKQQNNCAQVSVDSGNAAFMIGSKEFHHEARRRHRENAQKRHTTAKIDAPHPIAASAQQETSGTSCKRAIDTFQ